MRIIGIILLGLIAINASAGQQTPPAIKPATPAPVAATPAQAAPAIGEKELEAAIKDYCKVVARESDAAKKQRQQAVVDSIKDRNLILAGKLGREEISKKGKIMVDVVDDSPTRTIVVTKIRDTVTGVKIGKDITIKGIVTNVRVTPRPEFEGKVLPPRIDVTVE